MVDARVLNSIAAYCELLRELSVEALDMTASQVGGRFPGDFASAFSSCVGVEYCAIRL
jgi:hypothetical protein